MRDFRAAAAPNRPDSRFSGLQKPWFGLVVGRYALDAIARVPIIAICSAERLAEAEQWCPDAHVLVHAPGHETSSIDGVASIRFTFHDVEVDSAELRGITRLQMDDFLSFVRTGRKRLLVSCKLGLSRSPALAVLVLIAHGVEPRAACERVFAAVPTASPNRQVLRIGTECLCLDIDLVAVAEAVFRYRRGSRGPIGDAQPLSLVQTADVDAAALVIASTQGKGSGGAGNDGALVWPQTTGQAIADFLGFSAPWLRTLEKQGFVERQGNGLYDAGAVCRGYIRWLKDSSRRTSKTEVAKLKEAEQLRKLRIENRKAAGELIDFETIEFAFIEMFTVCRNAIDGIPAGVTRDLGLRAEIKKLQDLAFEQIQKSFAELMAKYPNGLPLDSDDTVEI